VANLPPGSQKRPGNILAHGEVTGHSHRIRQAEAMQLWEQNNTMFLEVIGEKATLVHEEHRPLELTRVIYKTIYLTGLCQTVDFNLNSIKITITREF
jgi:hypothetical protein